MFAVVQTLEGVVISPRIMKGRVGLHPLTIIIAVMVGTTLLGGVLGGVLAIPLTAVLRVLMERYVWKRPAPQGKRVNTSAQTERDPTRRFSSRVENYVRFRPGYPKEILGLLQSECGLKPAIRDCRHRLRHGQTDGIVS